MTIFIEFYGVPRRRVGADRTSILACRSAATLGEVWNELARLYPDWAAECLDQGRLRNDFSANIDGERFVHEPDTVIEAGDSLLIMSADAGG